MSLTVTSTSVVSEIGKRAKAYRIDYPMTQKELAERSGVSLKSIQNFESGSDIQFRNLIKILSALDLEENLYLLVPDNSKRPSMYIENIKPRQRARRLSDTNQSAFVWGEDIK